MWWSTAHNNSLLLPTCDGALRTITVCCYRHVMEHCAQQQFVVTAMWWSTAHNNSLFLPTCDGALRTITVFTAMWWSTAHNSSTDTAITRSSEARFDCWCASGNWDLQEDMKDWNMHQTLHRCSLTSHFHRAVDRSYITDSWLFRSLLISLSNYRPLCIT